jgi:hypothetical protein
MFMGNLAADPGSLVAGQMWYNSAEDTVKYYNGTAVVIVPGIGGGSSSSYTLPYSYMVYKTGSTYYMEKYDGTTWSSTNGSKVINYALGNLTSGRYYPEKVSIRGDWVVDSSIQMPAWSMLEGPARINFTSGLSNENMIEFRDSTNAIGIWVKDLVLYGTSTGNTGCRGIYFESNMPSSVVDPSKEQRIATVAGCKIQYFDLEGITCVDTYSSYDVGSYRIEENMVHYNYRESGSYDINMTDVTDSYVIGNEFSTGYFRHVTASQIKDNYFGGGNSGADAVYLYGLQGTQFCNNIVDLSYYNGITIYGSQIDKLTISGNRISNSGQQTNATYYGIYIDGTVGTSNIIVTDNQIYLTSTHLYMNSSIYQASGADYNIFSLNILKGYASDTGGYGIAYYGSNNEVANNIGSTKTLP